jgi:hypothetical protein
MLKPQFSFVDRPISGESCCGDGLFDYRQNTITRFMHADGMGHGAMAYQAVCLLKKQMLWLCHRSVQLASMQECVKNLHKQLSELDHNYQAAVAIVDINQDSGTISAVAIGNVEIRCFNDEQMFCFPSLHGMVGGRLPSRYQVTTYSPALPALLTSWSDGIDSRAAQSYLKQLATSRSLMRLDPLAIAQRVMTDFAKSTDDASCLVAILQDEQV